MTSVTFKVVGMTCAHCATAVTRALAKLPGITRVVEVSVARGEATVEGTPDVAAITAAVRAEGYEAHVTPY